MLKKVLLWFVGIVLVAVAGLWLFWPKEYTVKGPMLDFLTGRQAQTPDAGMVESRFHLPPGFRIGIFATDVPHARMMRITGAGDLLVSSMREGNVILLHRDEDGDGKADGRTVLLTGLNVPHGLALYGEYLYVAETDRVVRAPFNAAARTVGAIESVFEGLPAGGNHRTRTIGFGPDGWLYVTVGSSCNVCIETEAYRASMLRMRSDGSDAETFAVGLRNTVGFDWQPGTGALFGTDNGRDLLGDDTPNCELNRIEAGGDYGWPVAYDDRVPDPDFGAGQGARIAASRGPAHGFGAHRAPLGMRFLNAGREPAGYEGAALVALHGSWNRSSLAGYKVVSLHFGADGQIEERDFLTGFEKDEDVIGRPVDVQQGPDGAIYVSDDYAGVIYRIGWGDMAVGDMAADRAPVADPLAGLDTAEKTRLVLEGAVLFSENGCAACHVAGQMPEGGAGKLLKDLKARYDIAGIESLLIAPPGPMPSFDLTAEERRALAVYVLATY
ncbi:MAG: sorbosone dehydrogenase family protein [Alphaproteobacteria bacterium]|nr:MAG: sorbosone dehydrogenase family protein [Alphaproteobacteria bacterium]